METALQCRWIVTPTGILIFLWKFSLLIQSIDTVRCTSKVNRRNMDTEFSGRRSQGFEYRAKVGLHPARTALAQIPAPADSAA